MFLKNHFGLIAGLLTMMVLGFAMAIVGTFATGAPFTVAGIFRTGSSAFMINLITALILPVDSWAFAACRKLKPGSLPFLLLSTLIRNAVYVTAVSIFMVALETGFGPIFPKAWISLYPILFIAGYIVSGAFTPAAGAIAGRFAKP
jgi:hypothetical protein